MKGYEKFPTHWDLVRLKRIARINPPCDSHGLKPEDIVTFAPMECIRTNRRIPKDAPLSNNNSSYTVFNNGDIALAKVTPCFENDNICVMENLTNGYAFGSSELFNVRPLNIDTKFLLYYLMSHGFKSGGVAHMTGAIGLKRVPSKYLRNVLVPLPPKDEQDQIARFLDWKITEIDKLTAIRREELKNLAELKKALITREVTRGDWEHVRLKNVVRVRSEKGTYRDKTDDKYIGLENIKGYSEELVDTDTEYDTSIQSICREGDLLFGKLRPYLAKAIIAPYDAFCTSELLIISNFAGDIRYLRYVMLNPEFIREVDSSTYGVKMPRANTSYILNISIPVPPISEQQKIADYLDRICTRIDSAITNFTQQIDTLKELKARLISDTVTGKIDVRNIPVPEQEKIL